MKEGATTSTLGSSLGLCDPFLILRRRLRLSLHLAFKVKANFGLAPSRGDVKNLVELVEIRDWSVEAFRVLSNIRWPLAASRRSHDRPRKPNKEPRLPSSRSESNIPPTPTESPAQSATPWASASATLERKSGLRLRLCVARPSGWDSSMVCRVQISSLKVA